MSFAHKMGDFLLRYCVFILDSVADKSRSADLCDSIRGVDRATFAQISALSLKEIQADVDWEIEGR
jgi:hypothetical protein